MLEFDARNGPHYICRDLYNIIVKYTNPFINSKSYLIHKFII